MFHVKHTWRWRDLALRGGVHWRAVRAWLWRPPGAGGPRRNWAEFCSEKILNEISERGRGADSSQRHSKRARFSFVGLPFSPIVPRISGRFHRLPKTARNCLLVPQAFTQPPSFQALLLNPHILSILHRCPTYPTENVYFMSLPSSFWLSVRPQLSRFWRSRSRRTCPLCRYGSPLLLSRD